MKKTMKTTLGILSVAAGLGAIAANAEIVLYQESFSDLDGQTIGSGSTPEINPNGAGVLQSSGVIQTASDRGGDVEWDGKTKTSGLAQGGLRFGANGTDGGFNWASGQSKADILAEGGFAVSFNYKNWSSDPGSIFGVIVGSNGAGETSGTGTVDIDDASLTFSAAIGQNGSAETWDNGVNQALTPLADSNVPVEFLYEFSSFDAGSTVNFTMTRNGVVLGTDTFQWDATDDVRIRLVNQGIGGGPRIDDVTVTAIPEPATLGLVAAFGGAVLFIRRRFMI